MSASEPKLRIGRRVFTEQSLLLLLSGVTITVAGCGSDDNPNPGGPSGQTDVNGSISANHGHVATIASARITSGGAIVAMDIMGTATHPHSIDISAAQIGQIAAKTQVTVTSTTNTQHNHTVTFG